MYIYIYIHICNVYGVSICMCICIWDCCWISFNLNLDFRLWMRITWNSLITTRRRRHPWTPLRYIYCTILCTTLRISLFRPAQHLHRSRLEIGRSRHLLSRPVRWFPLAFCLIYARAIQSGTFYIRRGCVPNLLHERVFSPLAHPGPHALPHNWVRRELQSRLVHTRPQNHSALPGTVQVPFSSRFFRIWDIPLLCWHRELREEISCEAWAASPPANQGICLTICCYWCIACTICMYIYTYRYRYRYMYS